MQRHGCHHTLNDCPGHCTWLFDAPEIHVAFFSQSPVPSSTGNKTASAVSGKWIPHATARNSAALIVPVVQQCSHWRNWSTISLEVPTGLCLSECQLCHPKSCLFFTIVSPAPQVQMRDASQLRRRHSRAPSRWEPRRRTACHDGQNHMSRWHHRRTCYLTS